MISYRACEVIDPLGKDGISKCIFHGWTKGENPRAICEFIDGSVKFIKASDIKFIDICVEVLGPSDGNTNISYVYGCPLSDR